MAVLSVELRNKLERTIIKARDVAEAGAKAALEALAVHNHEPYSHMSPDERKLRNHLRARARQLGDKQNQKGELKIAHLVWECAYEHWHRMLFARFLAENELLIEPEMGVAISLDECEELAKEDGEDLWTLASEFAQQMLPQIFRPDNPVLRVSFASEHRLKLENLLNDLESATFMASDSLGWVYQFWQSKRKKEVNQSGNKIGADELPAVTQLFTEPYMVSFLLDNSLGAWWAVLRLKENDLKSTESEEDLRRKASLLGVPLKYLRFTKCKGDIWSPSVGTIKGWPNDISKIKILDPCCGSGHFLVAAFLMLVPMRMKLEDLSAREAVEAVLRDNLYGLEIDQRCVELSAFALAMAAWRFPDSGGFRQLPELKLACSGLAIGAKREEWLALSKDNTNFRIALDELYKQFKLAPVLGSLIDPEAGLAKDTMFELKWENVAPLVTNAISEEQDEEKTEIGVVAQGIAKAADLLTQKYTLIATNVPYLKGGDHGDTLKEFCERYYEKSKYDIATVFIDRCQNLLMHNGLLAVVTQQYWLFLKYYEGMREKYIRSKCLGLIARLGPGAFEGISGEVVNVCLQITIQCKPNKDYQHAGFEFDQLKGVENKMRGLKEAVVVKLLQAGQLNNPNKRISFELTERSVGFLSAVADFGKGSVSGDGPHYLRKFWEVDRLCEGRKKWLNSPKDDVLWSGREHFILWGIDSYHPEQEIGFRFHGQRVFGKKGVAIGKAGKLRFTPYTGELFDDNLAVVCPYNDAELEGIWSYCTSGEFEKNLRMLDKKMSVTAGTFTKVPFDATKWISSKSEYDIRNPSTDDPTQWIFHGHPANSIETLQVAIARLLGYRWPAETEPEMELNNDQLKWLSECDNLLKSIDEDGIVCIPAVRAEDNAASRLRELLNRYFAQDWSLSKEQDLIRLTGANNSNLDVWLRDYFFKQHCKLFHHRPFIWHIWDGRSRDGFHALVNYHKLVEDNGKGRQLLENLTYSYLGDWITRQKEGIKRSEGGSEDRLAAALELQKRLIAIIEGEPPFDIFVRWKSIENQSVGWEPDMNDGVRLNIRPFMAQDIPGGCKGAGILRWKPNIKWTKDRGKETSRSKEQYPWFWEDGEFTGDRVNDIHLTNEEKRQAREKAKES